ncbi:uncharacterized protein LOC141665810 [Apium graveolens]|uniref:uncharacterized protein LOC141665810 n=1 Tax=Apium graveolens TaxID=4045 RepID=UPI003D79C883
MSKVFYEHIVTRFGIPRILITDNGRQFIESEFEEYLTAYGIQHRRSSVAYPQSNGQFEVTDRNLLESLKKNVQDSKALWVEELPNILWAYRTDTRKPTGESAFRVSYDTEALIPVEIGESSSRVQDYNSQLNQQGLRTNMDFLEERKENALIRMANYKQKTALHFGKVLPRQF